MARRFTGNRYKLPRYLYPHAGMNSDSFPKVMPLRLFGAQLRFLNRDGRPHLMDSILVLPVVTCV